MSSSSFIKYNVPNCINVDVFMSTIIRRLPYIGASESRFYLCELDGIRFLAKVYFKGKDAREIYRSDTPSTGKFISNVDAEIQILNLFKKEIIYVGVSPHIIELIYNKTCSVFDLVPNEVCVAQRENINIQVDTTDEFIQHVCHHKLLVNKKLAHPDVIWLMLEHGNLSLAELMEKTYVSPLNVMVIRIILFHIIYTMYAITSKFPRFKHNDLHGENIVLLIDATCNLKQRPHDLYKCAKLNTSFAIPYLGITSKIIDFGNSEVPEHNILSFATGNQIITHDRAENDIILLLHWVYIHMVLRHGSAEIEDMLKTLEPNQTYIKFDTERIREIGNKIPTYDQMLLSSAFASYQVSMGYSKNIRNTYMTS